MKKDVFSTRGGEFGFRAIFKDGSSVNEGEMVWDDVPNKPISRLELIHLPTGVVYAHLDDLFTEYFFLNEAVDVGSFSGTGGGARNSFHTAKIFGGVRSDGVVNEARFTFEGRTVKGSKREYPKEQFVHLPSVLRGAPGKSSFDAARLSS